MSPTCMVRGFGHVPAAANSTADPSNVKATPGNCFGKAALQLLETWNQTGESNGSSSTGKRGVSLLFQVAHRKVSSRLPYDSIAIEPGIMPFLEYLRSSAHLSNFVLAHSTAGSAGCRIAPHCKERTSEGARRNSSKEQLEGIPRCG